MGTANTDKTVGIIGGMGPEATVDVMQRIIRLTPAKDDADHIRCIVDNNPKVPSRIKSIIEGIGEDPTPTLVEMAKGLERAGADFLAMPCNTAHFYYNAINQAVEIPVLHIIELVLNKIRDRFPKQHKVGILASPAIQITKIYDQRFNAAGIELIYPNETEQQLLFELIKKIKTGQLDSKIEIDYQEIIKRLVASNNIEVIIVACTELSILKSNSSQAIIDAAEILAEEIVNLAKLNA